MVKCFNSKGISYKKGVTVQTFEVYSPGNRII